MTPKQQRFVEEYLKEPDATKAAIRAKYSKNTAGQIGYQLLQKTLVRKAIEKGQLAAQERTGVTVDRVLKELAAIGFADMGTYLKLDGKDTTARLDWSKLPKSATKIIQEITQEEHTGGRGHETGQVRRTKFKLYSKLDALEKLARHLGMYDDKMTLNAGSSLVELMKRIDGRTRGLGDG